MRKNVDDLMAATQELERLVGAGQRPGPGDESALDRALARLEEAVSRHADSLREPDALVGHVDRPCVPSPGLDRRTQHLREELTAILADIRSLRARVEARDQSSAATARPATQGTADHGAIVRRARQFIEALQAFENEEAGVILDAVNTDIGAGD